jgi:hypothetical protein
VTDREQQQLDAQVNREEARAAFLKSALAREDGIAAAYRSLALLRKGVELGHDAGLSPLQIRELASVEPSGPLNAALDDAIQKVYGGTS